MTWQYTHKIYWNMDQKVLYYFHQLIYANYQGVRDGRK